MAKVRVKSFTTVRTILGAAAVDFEAPEPATLGGALEALIAQYGRPLREALCDPDTGDLTPFPIKLNEEMLSSLSDRDRPVKTGDEITIIFPVGGGR